MANAQKVAYFVAKAGHEFPETVMKRDGTRSRFDINRIESAVARCFAATQVTPKITATEVAEKAASAVAARTKPGQIPSVEEIQDTVEIVLQSAGEFEAAKNYILYRANHAEQRQTREIPDEIRQIFNDASQYFKTDLQQFMFFDKYSRYNYDLGRRETWIETVDRSVDFLRELSNNLLDDETYSRIHKAILNMQAMPSMRLLATAGDYARDQNLAIFNCSYLPAKDIESFCEALLISMSGCGVGFSVESYYVEQFPRIKRQKKNVEPELYIVDDSTDGWIDAVRFGLTKWFNGEDVKFDTSFIRRAGLPLRRKGGRASGPGPLINMLATLRSIVTNRQGVYLRPIDAHDIMCAIGDAAVQGGVRRTAMISLFDWDDLEMRNCKSGPWGTWPGYRENANNSAVWPEDLNQRDFIQQMLDMDAGNRGEPGIFSRENAKRTKPKRRKSDRFGTNPCGEIILRPFQLCNLSIIVARPEDTQESLLEKAEIATIIGTIQSMAQNFPGLREEWIKNQQEERLLGVDILGQMDSPASRDPEIQDALKAKVIETNAVYAEKLGINPSASTTCVKPGGNSSMTLGTSSSIDGRHSAAYRRNMRVSATSPVYKALKDAGVPLSPENGQTVENARTWVVSFPVKAPDGAILKSDRSAIDQLEYWLQVKTHWTEHNPSATIVYSPDEFLDVIKWVWQNKDKIGGLSFLPRDNASYNQMPYEEISLDEYELAAANFPKIDFSKIYRHELEDMTTATHELACFAGVCET